ncbi:MAG TPA: hypothetical protein VM914_12465 [Pyrinomonadaceae bacterium]|nr:hypothetical protein [Pyrinomonadaceae bacterium]
MAGKKGFPLPEMPGVCLSCGAHAPLAPRKFVFNVATTFSATLMVASPLLWAIYSRSTAYRPELPICGECSGSLGRAKRVSVVASLIFLPLLAGSFAFVLDFPFVFFVPISFGLAAYLYHARLLKQGTPLVKLADRKNLILFIPNYGEFVLFKREKSSGGRGPGRRAAETLTLNRSVCGGCGFINFAGAGECKKCASPLGQTAAA